MLQPIAVRNRLTTPYGWKVLGNLKQCSLASSAVELSLSSLGAVRKPRRTHRRWLSHSVTAPIARSGSLICLWSLSNIPFDCGWKAVVVMCSTCKSSHQLDHVRMWTAPPPWEVKHFGTPKGATQQLMKASSTVSAEMSARGTASNHLVLWSMVVSR